MKDEGNVDFDYEINEERNVEMEERRKECKE
jgi:hypothetical protein